MRKLCEDRDASFAESLHVPRQERDKVKERPAGIVGHTQVTPDHMKDYLHQGLGGRMASRSVGCAAKSGMEACGVPDGI